MELTLHEFLLPLKDPFTIARGSIDHQPTLIVELSHEGISGFGEATANRYYGVTLDTMRASLEPLQESFREYEFTDAETCWTDITHRLASNPFAQCALDEAAYDYWGKKLNAPVYRLWGWDPMTNPPSNFTIGIDTIDNMVRKLRENPGWPIYKIKLGTGNDLDIVRALRKSTEAVFRVDANCGWTAEQTVEFSGELANLGVEYIEQPLPANAWDQMQDIYSRSQLPLIADESCQVPDDVDRCHGHFHGINIKLVKCGGLTPARGMIARARELRMKVMVGCMVESTVGISAIAQLLPQLDYVDMDGPALISQDIATGATLVNGKCHYADVPGNGVQLLNRPNMPQ